MITVVVNGRDHVFDGDPSLSLLVYLRDVLNMTNIRSGCLMASCKSCVVYVDCVRCVACAVPMSDLNTKSVTTAPEW